MHTLNEQIQLDSPPRRGWLSAGLQASRDER